VAVDAGVVGFAAAHFDGDDVSFAVVVAAAGAGIEVEAVDFWHGLPAGWVHRFGLFEALRLAEGEF
jgi:hypothetical protein